MLSRVYDIRFIYYAPVFNLNCLLIKKLDNKINFEKLIAYIF